MESTLRILLITEWVLIVTSLIADFRLKKRLPKTLQTWMDSDEADAGTAPFSAYALFLVCTFISTLGLFYAQVWAVWLYIITTFLSSLPIGPTEISHPVAVSADEYSVLVSGSIIALSVILYV